MEQLLIILLTVFLSILFVFLTVSSVLVYFDSRKREMNSITWLLIIWLIPLGIGLVVYLSNRKETGATEHNE